MAATTKPLLLTSAPDRLALATLVALATLALFTDHAPTRPIAFVFGAMVLILAVARWGLHSSAGHAVHRFVSPYVAVVCAFELSGMIIDGADRGRWDDSLSTFDDRFFHELSVAWRSALGRPGWLTDAASIVYVSFYFLPLVLGLALYLRGRKRELDELVLLAEVSFFLSYVGYILFPARGPRLPVPLEARALGGGPISAAVRAFINRYENNDVDAFPSGHTLVSLVLLALGWRYFPRVRAALVALVAAIVFSTVYLSFHYVVDVVAGALAAALVVVVDFIEGPSAARRAQSIDVRTSAASTSPSSAPVQR